MDRAETARVALTFTRKPARLVRLAPEGPMPLAGGGAQRNPRIAGNPEYASPGWGVRRAVGTGVRNTRSPHPGLGRSVRPLSGGLRLRPTTIAPPGLLVLETTFGPGAYAPGYP